MKRILATVSFALFAAPVFATPFEQTQLDRGLDTSAQVERASAGSSSAGNVWAKDHNFVAPAQ